MSIRTLALSCCLTLGAPMLPAQTERVLRLPIEDGRLSVLALTRALLDEYGFDGSQVTFRDVRVDVAGTKGSLLLFGISKSLGDSTRLRKSVDGSHLLVTIDPVRTQAVRRQLKERVGKALSALVGHDILARRYELALPPGLGPTERFVLGVHGVDSSGRIFQALRQELAAAPTPMRCATFDYANDEAIDRIATELAVRLRRQAQACPQRRIVMVAHSMGGLVARRMLEDPRLDPGNVDTLILLGVPNQGSRLAQLRSGNDLLQLLRAEPANPRLLAPWFDGMGEAGWDLRPGSPFLTRLDRRPRNPRVTYRLILGTRGLLTAEELAARRAALLARVRRLEHSAVWEPKLAAWLADLDELVHGKGDGAVSVARGQLPGVAAVLLPVSHLGMLRAAPAGQRQPVFERIHAWIAAARRPR